MKLLRYGERGAEKPGILDAQGTIRDLSQVVKDKSGQPAHARIEAVTNGSVRLNMNHPLAGKTLDFEVTIAGMRPATADEVAHGHVHTGEHHGG